MLVELIYGLMGTTIMRSFDEKDWRGESQVWRSARSVSVLQERAVRKLTALKEKES